MARILENMVERIEAFGGLAILTTNARHDLDDAFVRRLRFVVEFPPQDSPGQLPLSSAEISAALSAR